MSEERRQPPQGKSSSFIFNPLAALLLFATLILVAIYFVIAWKRVLNVERPKDIATESSQCAQFKDLAQAQRLRFEKTDTGDPSAPLTQMQMEYASRLLKTRAMYIAECRSGQENDDWFLLLRGRYETTLSAQLTQESSDFEKKGREAMTSEDFGVAFQSFVMALKLQDRINVEFPSSAYANISRSHSLEKLSDDANYRPLLAVYQKLKEEGDLNYDKGDYAAARENYTKALSHLRTIAYKIPSSYFNCDEKIRLLGTRNSEIGARVSSMEVDSVIADAQTAATSGDYEKAATLFSQAIERQRAVAKEFPQSSMAGAERWNFIEKTRQNTLSQPVERRLSSALDKLATALEAGDDNGVQNTICEAQMTYLELLRTYAVSDAAKNPSFKKIPYLFSVRADVCMLRKALMEHLRDIPGDSQWKMLDREVSQMIFVKICGGNPSARKADNLPVEGLTMTEARLFAQRLSWIIGKDVRLPDIARYMAAVKPVDASWVRKGTWNCVTAPSREIQPVATSAPDARGYYDLIGNVSEWIEPESINAAQAVVIGGSVRDNPIRLTEIPQDPHDITERIRNNGFRVIVNTGGK